MNRNYSPPGFARVSCCFSAEPHILGRRHLGPAPAQGLQGGADRVRGPAVSGLRSCRAAAPRSCEEVQHPAGAIRFPAAHAQLVVRRGGECPLLRHQVEDSSATNTGYSFSKTSRRLRKTILRGTTERFADDHKVALPFVVDPNGDLAAKVQSRLPSWPESRNRPHPHHLRGERYHSRTPFVEVVDRTQLYQLIDQVQKEAGDSPSSKTASAKSIHKEGHEIAVSLRNCGTSRQFHR